MDRIPSRKATNFVAIYSTVGKPPPGTTVGKMPDLWRKADGGITTAADGLIDGSAKLMGPGPTLYQWREPETGGEAFIPLGPGKRPRSKALVAQVAGMFGGTVTFANGGGYGMGGGSAGGRPSVTYAPTYGQIVLQGAPEVAGRQLLQILRDHDVEAARIIAQGTRGNAWRQ
jgi:hypothetical protein